MCLGPNGFTVCDERALWILTKRTGTKTYSLVSLLNPSPYGMCLQRKPGVLGIGGSGKVGMGDCSKKGSKQWSFEFVDKTHVKLSSQGQCLVRGKAHGNLKNSMSLQPCPRQGGGGGHAFIPLTYYPTAVHQSGFFLKTADGKCFDGASFRSCAANTSKLLWGVGIKYVWGRAKRYFFSFHHLDRDSCIVAEGGRRVKKGACADKGALEWGLRDGELSIRNGQMCLARLSDNSATMARCASEGSEYITVDVPNSYTEEDLADMLKNQDKLTPEEKNVLAQLLKQSSLSNTHK